MTWFARAAALAAPLLVGCASGPTTAPAVAPADPLVGGVVETAEGTWRVAYEIDPAPLPLNEVFAVRVEVRDATTNRPAADEVGLIVDGRMPAHRHGMVRTPRVERTAPGCFRVDGMLFHMPGDWVLTFDVERRGVVERAAVDLVLD